jgi:MauM/NapG family ferredoxin protein
LKKERSKKYRIFQYVRILCQIFFFGLFFYLLLGTRFPDGDYIGRVEIFFHFDPLLALTTLLASRVVFLSFILAAITLVVTFLLGRVACGWICPLGSLHQFFSFLFKKTKILRPEESKDNHTAWKYYLLIVILIGTLFSLNLVGFLDPLSLLYRSFAVGFIPAFNLGISSFIGLLYKANLSFLGDSLVQFFETLDINAIFLQGFFIGLLFIGTILLNVTRERFWCRYLCPLGAFLGLTSRWNLFKLKISSEKCIECSLCNHHCQTQASPFPEEKWKSSECDYCFTCSAICPTSAIGFPVRMAPEEIKSVDLSRRKLILTSLVGAFVVPFFRLSPATNRASEKLIRPPGALPEEQFLQKCVKCGACMKVCPTNAIQPALTEAGPEGLWTPMLVPEIGYCEYYCSLCTQVCPTGAIKELDIESKNKVIIGLAWIDRNRCIPWIFGDPCIVCEEHCPVSPKAIQLMPTEVKLKGGIVKTPLTPFINLETCTGCGICENKCPVVDKPAVYITSVGESRSERNQVLLDIIKSENDIF